MHYLDGDMSEPEAGYQFPQQVVERIAKHFACMERLLRGAQGHERKVLIVASDSNALGQMAFRHFRGKFGIDDVLVQNISTTANIDKVRAPKHFRASLFQAMHMWWLMKN